MIQQASLKAFEKAKINIVGRRLQVYNAIKELGQATDKEVSDYINLPINCVTPRRQELQKANHIYCCGEKKSDSNISVAVWRVR